VFTQPALSGFTIQSLYILAPWIHKCLHFVILSPDLTLHDASLAGQPTSAIAPRHDYEVIDHVTKACNPIGAQPAERGYKRQLTRSPDPSLPVRKWTGPRDYHDAFCCLYTHFLSTLISEKKNFKNKEESLVAWSFLSDLLDQKQEINFA